MKTHRIYFEKIIEDIDEKGWSETRHFFSEAYMLDLFRESNELWQQGEFRKAGVGIGVNLQVRPEIRSDNVIWMDPDNLTGIQLEYWDTINRLRVELNQAFFIGLNGFEAHFAVYEPGSFYKKHLDQFKQVKYRIISCILYLNINWQPEFGGYLRIYNDEETFTDIEPQAGTFVCFRSDTVYHEVLPASQTRYSLTGWLKHTA